MRRLLWRTDRESSEQAYGCSLFVLSSIRELERGASIPRSLLLEPLDACGAAFLEEVYRKPLLSLRVAQPLSRLLLEVKLPPHILSRAASILEVASRAGFQTPPEALALLARNDLTRNRAWRIGLNTLVKDPLSVLACEELAGDRGFARLLRVSLGKLSVEEAFSEALRKRLSFQALLAVLSMADKREALTFLASRLLSHGREASLALRALLAMGVRARIAARTPAALVLSLASGASARRVEPAVLERAFIEAQAAAVLLDRHLPERVSGEAVRRTAVAVVKLAELGEPAFIAEIIVRRTGLFLAAAEAWEKHGALEEVVRGLRRVLGPYALAIYAAILQRAGGEYGATALRLLEMLKAEPTRGGRPSPLARLLPLRLGAKRRTTASAVRARLDGYTVYVDVSNVIGKRGSLTLEDLRDVVQALAERGVEEIVLCYDSNLPWKLFGHLARDRRRLYYTFRQQLQRVEKFAEGLGVPIRVLDPAPGQSADELIVESVERCIEDGGRCLILSNDRYAEFSKRLSWLRDEGLFIRFRYDGKNLVLYWRGKRI